MTSTSSVWGVLERCRAAGIELVADGAKLRYRASKGVMTPELLALFSAYKGELLARLPIPKNCKKCGRVLDAAGRCFWCQEWVCACGRFTGSSLISMCQVCQLALETHEQTTT
jgi:hypothetical protein